MQSYKIIMKYALEIYEIFRIFASMMKLVRPKKNLGQHFLTDLTIAKRIADTVDACPDIPVLEVGPGMGVMTQYLVEKPRPFKVVEIDRESVAYLNEHFPNSVRTSWVTTSFAWTCNRFSMDSSLC